MITGGGTGTGFDGRQFGAEVAAGATTGYLAGRAVNPPAGAIGAVGGGLLGGIHYTATVLVNPPAPQPFQPTMHPCHGPSYHPYTGPIGPLTPLPARPASNSCIR